MGFAEVIKQKIKSDDISVRELARRMGRSHVYVGDLVAGNRRWNEETMNEACKAVGITVSFDQNTEKGYKI